MNITHDEDGKITQTHNFMYDKCFGFHFVTDICLCNITLALPYRCLLFIFRPNEKSLWWYGLDGINHSFFWTRTYPNGSEAGCLYSYTLGGTKQRNSNSTAGHSSGNEVENKERIWRAVVDPVR